MANVSANKSETVGHKDVRFGQIVYILVFYNIHFLGFFHGTVSNVFFGGQVDCVTTKTKKMPVTYEARSLTWLARKDIQYLTHPYVNSKDLA